MEYYTVKSSIPFHLVNGCLGYGDMGNHTSLRKSRLVDFLYQDWERTTIA